MATDFSILAWRIQRTRSLADYSMWGCKASDMTEHACARAHTHTHTHTHTQLVNKLNPSFNISQQRIDPVPDVFTGKFYQTPKKQIIQI